MKNKIKILLIAAMLLCTKYIKAQGIKSTLTQVTTDLLKGNNQERFDWNFKPPKPMTNGRIIFVVFSTKELVLFIEEPGGAGGGGGADPCECKPGMSPSDCEAWKKYCKDNQTSGGTTIFNPLDTTSGGTSGGNFPGTGIPPGPIPLPFPPQPGGTLNNPTGGGGSAPANPAPGVPPPTQPQTTSGQVKPPREDTTQPKKMPCNDPDGKKIADSLTDFMQYNADSTNEMKYIKDSCVDKKVESGIVFRPRRLSNLSYGYKVDTLIKDGRSQGVLMDTRQHGFVTLHTHIVEDSSGNKQDETPSTQDFFLELAEIMKTQTEYIDSNGNTQYAPKLVKFFAMINIHNGSHQQYALAATDTNDVKNFYTPNIAATYLDTNKFVYDSSTFPPTQKPNYFFNNWKGDINDKTTYLGLFGDVVIKFKKENYPEEKINTYANVFMLQELKIPIKIFSRNSDGEFKQFKFVLETKTENGVITDHYTIIECQ